MARAVKYLHHFEPVVVHGNIRGVRFPFFSSLQHLAHEGISQSNILIDGEEQPILCDYGLALTSAKTAMSYRWAAPEILNPVEEDMGLVRTTESDVYAFAMTVLEVHSLPFRL